LPSTIARLQSRYLEPLIESAILAWNEILVRDSEIREFRAVSRVRFFIVSRIFCHVLIIFGVPYKVSRAIVIYRIFASAVREYNEPKEKKDDDNLTTWKEELRRHRASANNLEVIYHFLLIYYFISILFFNLARLFPFI